MRTFQIESLEPRRLLTALVFEPASGLFASGAALPATYGSRVSATVQNGYQYGSAGGFTPNVVPSWGINGHAIVTEGAGYGSLPAVISTAANADPFQSELTADAGWMVSLSSIELGGFSHQNQVIRSLQIVDGSTKNVLFNEDNVTILGAGSGSVFTTISFPTPIIASKLIIQFDPSNIKGTGPNVGIGNITFSQVKPATITGTVFNDANDDGIQETGEAGLSGWRVFLDTNGDGIYETSETYAGTVSGGTYTFTAAPGTYKIDIVVPGGYIQTTPASEPSVTVTAGQAAVGPKFGVVSATALGTITGTVFSDANNNGVLDAGETGLASVRVFLDINGDGVWQSTEPSALTNSSGAYTLTAAPGAYKLAEVVPAGDKQTTPAGEQSITLAPAKTVVASPFGDVALTHGPLVQFSNLSVAPNTTAQLQLHVIDTDSASADDIEGMEFTIQISGGTGTTPSIQSVNLLTGTIWANTNAMVDSPVGGILPQFDSYSISTGAAGQFVNANGLLATVTFNTANAAAGVYTIKLIGTRYPAFDSEFLNGAGNPISSTFASGTLTVT